MRSDEWRDSRRIGMFNHPDRAWEVWREFNWEDYEVAGPWAVCHPEVGDEAMPNGGYFATWQEAMDFACEYERTKDWSQDMKLPEHLARDRARMNWFDLVT